MSPVQQELQIWTGGALNIIKLKGKLKNNKMFKNLKHFENLKGKKVKIEPCVQPTDLPKTVQVL